jgi:hypothetical protein
MMMNTRELSGVQAATYYTHIGAYYLVCSRFKVYKRLRTAFV